MSYTGCTLIPGLIDSHVHLFMSGTQNLDARKKQLEASKNDIQRYQEPIVMES